jgi:SAM-dependent methyltransferase
MDKLRHINPEVPQYLQYCQHKLNLASHEMRILDYGCGAGNSTLSLRLSGYEAFGVDIDEKAVLEGQKLLNEHGFDGKSILSAFRENTPIPFPDHTFHFVMSQEVLEHVSDISSVSRDLRRISAPDGMGFHVYRPQYNLLEQHFHMPFVHWLPKNKLRKLAILAFAYMGLGLHPREIPGAGPGERAEFLYQFSVNQTFYRPYWVIGSAFRQNGMGVCFPATNHRKLRKSRIISQLLDFPVLDKLLNSIVITFHNAYLLTQTPDEKGILKGRIQLGSWKSNFLL